jgi:hypothetical protein
MEEGSLSSAPDDCGWMDGGEAPYKRNGVGVCLVFCRSFVVYAFVFVFAFVSSCLGIDLSCLALSCFLSLVYLGDGGCLV